MKKGLVVYASRTGNTGKIAELIAEGMRFGGMEAQVAEVKEFQNEGGLAGFDAYVFGAPTYHGDMMASMKTFLFLAEKAQLSGKAGGSFGAYGWSGEAIERIYGTMKNVFGMDMVGDALRLKDPALGGGTSMAQDYGRSVAKKVLGE
ncbi:MAG: flavodoxin domain-containing protein [Proteobacteria bacterium]|nr:flavodoxin domain-containing protein [Pseudomonadota bacterium]